MKKLLCFDMDNTLINSDKAHAKGFQYAAKKEGYPKPTSKEIINLLGMPKHELVKKLFPKITKNEQERILRAHTQYIIEKGYVYAKRLRGTAKALKQLQKKYTIAITSNCNKRIMRYLLRGAHFPKVYDILIGNDDVNHSKPYPDEIFKAEQLTHHKATYMIGDSIYDVRAGKRAKVKTIAVLTGHTLGERLKKEKPDLILKSVKDLPKILLK